MRTGESGVRPPAFLELMFGFWRKLRPGSRVRKPALDSLSDHLLADVGLTGPGYGQPTWERYIHR
ncbi:MAG TPA: hypothetical protein VGQ35_19000 [Dongiaceae bacterium]|nr:hypothetical protein [Dongiaceae bacterium]